MTFQIIWQTLATYVEWWKLILAPCIQVVCEEEKNTIKLQLEDTCGIDMLSYNGVTFTIGVFVLIFSCSKEYYRCLR